MNKKSKIIWITLLAGLLMAILLFTQTHSQQMVLVSPGHFDTCESLSNNYGTWGAEYATVSIGNFQPVVGNGYIHASIPSSSYHAWIWKRTIVYDEWWDFSQLPFITMQIRPSISVPMELVVVTPEWNPGSVALPTMIANQWNTISIDLRTITYHSDGSQIDISNIRSIEIYALNNYQPMTVDIDNILVSGSLTPTPTPIPTPVPTSDPTPIPTPIAPAPTPTIYIPIISDIFGELDQYQLGLLMISLFIIFCAIIAYAKQKGGKSQ